MGPILIADDLAVTRELLTAVLNGAGYSTLAAENGLEALALLEHHDCALLLLDVHMPKLDGLGLLEKVRAQPHWSSLPVILLTSTADRQMVLRAVRLGVQGCFLKTHFHTQELCERIAKCLAAPGAPDLLVPHEAHPGSPVVQTPSPVPQPPPAIPACSRPPAPLAPVILTREATIARMEELTQAKTLAGVVAEVIAMTSSSRSDLHDLVRVIERDPLLASRVLHVANTAAFTSLKMNISTLEEAVRNIGVRAVRNIATSIGIFETFPSDAADGFNLIRCWQHSFAVASIMEILSADLSEREQDVAYMIGLCHDLGEIVLRQCCAAEYDNALQYAARLKKPFSSVQSSIFGLTSSELTSVVLTKLGLSSHIAGPIHEFSEAVRLGSNPVLSPLARTLKVANACAHGLLLAASAEAALSPISSLDFPTGRNSHAIKAFEGQRVRSDVLMTTHLLARLPSGGEDKLMQTIVPRSPARIWYAHHPAIATLDPLAMALGLLSRVSVQEHLPVAPAEMDELDLLIVAVPRPQLVGFAPADVERCLKFGGRKDLPVLYLTGQGDAVTGPSGTKVIAAHYPLTIAALGSLLQRFAHHPDTAPCVTAA